jgi:hypothetical protein
MEDQECTYSYYLDGLEYITPSLEYAIEKTDRKTIIAKCYGLKPKTIELK